MKKHAQICGRFKNFKKKITQLLLQSLRQLLSFVSHSFIHLFFFQLLCAVVSNCLINNPVRSFLTFLFFKIFIKLWSLIALNVKFSDKEVFNEITVNQQEWLKN
ncbi:hypothetical protein ACKWTF_007374 [Chironomus riparius]